MTIDISQFDRMPLPYANQGDKMAPPATSPTGFANMRDGYTKDYEISLKSGNPQAKAVERTVQNYLFNQSTEHQMLWQQSGLPPWFAGMVTAGVNGYQKNAVVIRQRADGQWYPYRSLIDHNLDDPLTTPTSWEYVAGVAEIIALIPMPSGAGVAANEIIAAGVDFNTLNKSATYEVQNATIASACTNLPASDGATAQPGMLEVKSWLASAGVTVILQRYTTATGRLFVRYNSGAAWSDWTADAFLSDVRNGVINYCAATNVANAYTLTATPAVGARQDGLRLWFKVPAANTGAVTINDGGGAKPLVGMGLGALVGNELFTGGIACVEWNSTAIASGEWVLNYCEGGAQQLAAGSYLQQQPASGDNSLLIPSTAWVNAVAAHGRCRLSVTSATQLTLMPYDGNIIVINGVPRAIPAGGITALNTGLAANTLYYVYVYMNGSAMTMEVVSTIHAAATNGIEIKNADPTRTLVGMIATNGSSQFVDATTQRYCFNWFNRRALSAATRDDTQYNFTSNTAAEITANLRISYLSWLGEGTHFGCDGNASNNSNGNLTTIFAGIDANTINAPFSANTSGGVGYAAPFASIQLANLLEGIHTQTVLGSVSTGTTGTLRSTGNFAQIRG